MAGHSKNRQGTMAAFREMAMHDEDAPPLVRDLFRRNSRWRGIVRCIARQQKWQFVDALVWLVMSDDSTRSIMELTMRRSPLLDKLEARA